MDALVEDETTSVIVRSAFTTAALRDGDGDVLAELLRGDPIHVLDDFSEPVDVRARERKGFRPSGRPGPATPNP